MTVSTVRDYFLRAGASFRKSDSWKKAFSDDGVHKAVLRSGRFGVGGLAAFLLGSTIEVTTRHVTELEYGVRFTASLESEAIEIKKCKCHIGTTISVQLDKDAVAALTGGGYHNFRGWDWYCLSHPVVARRVYEGRILAENLPEACQSTGECLLVGDTFFRSKELLDQEYTLPLEKSRLPAGNYRISDRRYRDIQWSYLDGPGLTCNGIRIGQGDIATNYPGWGKVYFKIPNISVFDPYGCLPLNLQRNGLATVQLPFEEKLFQDVIRDFVAFCLVFAPEDPRMNWRDRSSFEIDYSLSFRNCPAWLQTKSGVGIVDAFLLRKAKVDRILCHGLSGGRLVGELRPMPQTSIPTDGTWNSVRNTFYSWQSYPAGPGCDDVKCQGTRYLVHANDAKRWKMKGYLKRSFRESIVTEWETKAWEIWRLGQCEESEILKKIALQPSSPGPGGDIVAMEAFLAGDGPKKQSIIAEAWDRYVVKPLIPFDGEERRVALAESFKRLKKYIRYWDIEKKREGEEYVSSIGRVRRLGARRL